MTTVNIKVDEKTIKLTKRPKTYKLHAGGRRGLKGDPGTTDYNELENKPTIPTALSELSDDATHRLTTDAEKSTWNAALQSPDIGTSVQAWSAKLDSIASLTPGVEGRMISSNGLGGYTISNANAIRSYLNVEDGAEANNISDADATDLTDGGATTLHKHSYNSLDDKPTLGSAASADTTDFDTAGTAAGLVADYLPLTGGTLTGNLTTESIIPTSDSNYNLGSSSLYWSNAYTDRLYFNSTAYISGSTAGALGVTGDFGIGTTSPVKKFQVNVNTSDSSERVAMMLRNTNSHNQVRFQLSVAGDDSTSSNSGMQIFHTTDDDSGAGWVNYEARPLSFWTGTSAGSASRRITIATNGKVGFGDIYEPTARLHLPASTSSANTASLKIDAGTLASTPVSGNIESNGTHLYWTNSSGVRKQLDN